MERLRASLQGERDEVLERSARQIPEQKYVSVEQNTGVGTRQGGGGGGGTFKVQ